MALELSDFQGLPKVHTCNLWNQKEINFSWFYVPFLPKLNMCYGKNWKEVHSVYFTMSEICNLCIIYSKAVPNNIFVSRKNAGRFLRDLRRKKNKTFNLFKDDANPKVGSLSTASCIFLSGRLIGFSMTSLRETNILFGTAYIGFIYRAPYSQNVSHLDM